MRIQTNTRIHVIQFIDYPNLCRERRRARQALSHVTPKFLQRKVLADLHSKLEEGEEIASIHGICFTDRHYLPADEDRENSFITAWHRVGITVQKCERKGTARMKRRTSETVDSHLQRAIYQAVESSDDPRNLHIILVTSDTDYIPAISYAHTKGASVSVYVFSPSLAYLRMYQRKELSEFFGLYDTKVSAINGEPIPPVASRLDVAAEYLRLGKSTRIHLMTEERERLLDELESETIRCRFCQDVMTLAEFRKHPCRRISPLHLSSLPTRQDFLLWSASVETNSAETFLEDLAEGIREHQDGKDIRRVMQGVPRFNPAIVETALALKELIAERQNIARSTLMELSKTFPLSRVDIMLEQGIVVQSVGKKFIYKVPDEVVQGAPHYIDEILERSGATRHTNALLGFQGLASPHLLEQRLIEVFTRAPERIEAIRQRALIDRAKHQVEGLEPGSLSHHSLLYILAAPDIHDLRSLYNVHAKNAAWSPTEKTCMGILQSVSTFSESERLLDGIEAIARQCTDPNIDGAGILTVLAGCNLLTIELKGESPILHRASWSHPAIAMFQHPFLALRKCVA